MKARIIALVAVVLVAAIGAGGYVWHARSQRLAAERDAPNAATADLATVERVPRLVFRSTALGSNYGAVAIAPLSKLDGPRAFVGLSCDRVYARPSGVICLSADRGLVTVYKTQLISPQWAVTHNLPAAGLPSRARLSPDGSLAATSTFVYGDSYTNPGQFSTRTVIVNSAGATVADLENFQLTVDGRTVTAADKNIWGVTFVDNDAFYATAASGGHTWLVRGSIAAHTLASVRPDVECPSLSPDGTRIAFKKHGNLPPGQWRLAVYNLASGTETMLAETQSVDDQVEWLDNNTVLYGRPRALTGSATSDIWSVPADGSGRPQLLVHDAWSPAVVRTPAG